MGVVLCHLDSFVMLGLRFVPAAFLKPLAGTRVVGLARSGAKNHDGCNQLVDTAAVLCEWGWWDMNYSEIKYFDIANGEGVRTSVFVSGCRHHCPGCFNAVAWDFDYGQPFDKPTRNEVFASCQPDYIAGLSLLGGEPMEPENQRELLPFVRNFKALYPNKTVWCYSGYTWEQLTGKEPSLARCEATDELLSLLDVLVDGEFVQAKHDISLRFRGSSNQRLLDVKKTLAAGEPVWWEDEKVFATHTMEK